MVNAETQPRVTSLSPPDRFVIDQWAEQVAVSFGYGPLVLVGSVARAESWRDVDLRLMLPDDVLAALTGEDRLRHAALDLAFSCWGQRATGLPIDFQFQPKSERHDGPALLIGAPLDDPYRHSIPVAQGDR